MDPDAVPLEEAEEGMTVTVYPSHPSSSFLGSGLNLLLPTLKKATLILRDSLAIPRAHLPF